MGRKERSAANLTDGPPRGVSHRALAQLRLPSIISIQHILSILSTQHPIHTASYPPAAFADEVFKANVAKHKTYYESLRAQLGIVDFNPLTVDWTTPVPWGNDPDNCKMEDSSGAARQP